MWRQGWRDEVWAAMDQPWDILIVGGGITGAGILREATRLGFKTLLVEQRDFAWGTSSRSSKLVQGGLRYWKEGKVGLTRASVRERQRLLNEGAGLIDPLGFLLTAYKGDSPSQWVFRAGLSLYDLMALQWSHRQYSPLDLRFIAPHIAESGLEGGLQYGDAQTDDARLVLRVIREAVRDGGAAINYVQAESLLRDETGQVVGVRVSDVSQEPFEVRGQRPEVRTVSPVCRIGNARSKDIHARVVVNATGAWADRLRRELGAPARIRPLRGSHLIFPAWRLPVAQAISFLHPVDRRPVFIFPWEGVTLVGTTDVDHDQAMVQPASPEPAISPQEVAYLMAAADYQFPTLKLTLDDVVSTFAGVRPVIGTGEEDPSKESRDHVVWEENGLVTVTGGKLTTFRLIALDTLRVVAHRLSQPIKPAGDMAVLDRIDIPLSSPICAIEETTRRRLLGRYGADGPKLVAAARAGEMGAIPGTTALWAELRWAARAEGVVHLDDLLLRRVRLGLLLPQGGRDLLPRIRAICQPELGWDDARWECEETAYLALWQQHYSLPDRAAVPDWRHMVDRAVLTRRAIRHQHPRRKLAPSVQVILVTAVALGLWRLVRLIVAGRKRRRALPGQGRVS